jgi:nitrite reductase/ring-hydroxylating ferredoxin subunit
VTCIVPAGTAVDRLERIPVGGTRSFTLGQGDWPLRGMLVRVGDEVHAYVNRCPHAGRQLNIMPDRFLTPDGSLIQCQAHGALFEKTTGECVGGPCVGESLTRVSVVVIDGQVCLEKDIDVDQLATRPW